MSSALDYRLSDLKISFQRQNFNKLDGDRHISILASFTALLSSCFGTGILFMPYVFDHSGFLQGIVLLIVIGFLSYQGDYALFKVAKKLSSKNMKDMIYKTFDSPSVSHTIPILSLFQLVCSSVCYIVVIQSCLSRTMFYMNKRLQTKIPGFLCELNRRAG